MQTPGEVIGDAPPTVLDVFPSMRSPPEAVRASLEAVRAAQLAARARARREMWQARAVVGGVAAAVALAGLVVWPRIHGARAARAASAAAAASLARRAPATETGPVAAVTSAPNAGGLLAAGVAALPAVKENAESSAALEACRDNYQGKRWRAASAACATAFAARPDDVKLALRVAEAEYARDHLAEARDWAQRTLALDDKQADALAILGRSEQRTGNGEAAARAFRRYLALAPRGWHASEARAALRAEHGTARPGVTAGSRAAQRRERVEGPTPTAESAGAAPATDTVSTAPAAFAVPGPEASTP